MVSLRAALSKAELECKRKVANASDDLRAAKANLEAKQHEAEHLSMLLDERGVQLRILAETVETLQVS